MEAQLRELVSIPFKRESIYKVGDQEINVNLLENCFNSLQTGKHIQSQLTVYHSGLTLVSIPFKRESIYKATTDSSS